MTNQEKIICAAILLEDGRILYGRRHCDCYVACVTFYKKLKSKDGFVTSDNRFVDRKEAKKIAVKAGQCSEETLNGDELLSEDIY